ncbi:hypothetical protein [Propionivibrio sp.]|uniref:hypothetical protein n=1 Tax=Propionivibrio sp. TaxID=2212460 RepID=UPI003BF3D73A
MKISDKSNPPRGVFTLLTYRGKELVDEYVDDNLIVSRGRTNVVRLLGGDGSGLNVANIGFGTNGYAASPGNTALSNAFVKSLDGHSYPDEFSVLFTFSLGSGEANGMQISEFGLLTSSGLLHARKVRGGVLVKDSDLSLTGTWKLIY